MTQPRNPHERMASCEVRVEITPRLECIEVRFRATAVTGRVAGWRMCPGERGGYWVAGEIGGSRMPPQGLAAAGFVELPLRVRSAWKAAYDCPGLTYAVARTLAEREWIPVEQFREACGR